MTEHFYEPRGLYYRTNDFQPNRQTLIFVHGLSGSSAAWLLYEEFFGTQYNTLAFDLRGHGKSVKPARYEEYAIPHFADDLNQLIAYLKIHNAVLVSHSYGTLVALEYLATCANPITAAIFISPSFTVQKKGLSGIVRHALAPIAVLDHVPFSSKPRGHIEYARYPNTGDWNLRRMVADIRQTSLRVYLYATKQTYSFNREDFLGDIRIPVLIMHGKRDSIFPVQNSLTMAKHVKHAKLILLDHADHIIVLNEFPTVTKAIVTFLQTLR